MIEGDHSAHQPKSFYGKGYRRSVFGICGLFVVLPLALFGSIGALCAWVSSMPLWVPALMLAVGLVFGFWTESTNFDLTKLIERKKGHRFLLWFIFSLCWSLLSDLLATWAIPGSSHRECFKIGILIFAMTGWMVIILSAHAIRWVRGEL